MVASAVGVWGLDPQPAEPATPGNFHDLPGNRTCVSCNFILGLGLVAIEIALIWTITSVIAAKQVVAKPSSSAYTAHATTSRFAAVLNTAADSTGWLIALAGLTYWFLTFALYWNFISYLLTLGPIVTVPAIAYARLHATGTNANALMWRRVKLAGWLLGIMMLAAFTNVKVFPTQVYRHLNKARTTITPNDPLLLQLRDTFYVENPKAQFDAKPFNQRMSIVDEFVKHHVPWKEDYAQYGVLGLLTSPNDVLSHGAGDCQGQSAVTASLLFALGGVQAFCVETPFHWWTHAMDKSTGETYNLNSHGHAGLQGSVTPQPIDMIYTWYPPSCDLSNPNCTEVEAYNRNTMHYVAPPLRAFMTAFTGMHEFRRDVLPNFAGKNQWQLIAIGAVVGVVIAAYASYFQCDLSTVTTSSGFVRFAKRTGTAVPASVFAMYFMFVWGYVYYPVVMIHLVGLITFTLTFVCNDGYNRSIGTPIPIPAPTDVAVLLSSCARPATDARYAAVPSRELTPVPSTRATVLGTVSMA